MEGVKKEDLFTKETLIRVVEAGMMPNLKGDAASIKVREAFLKKLMESKDELYDYLWNRLSELLEFAEHGEGVEDALKEIGTRHAARDLIRLADQYVEQTTEAFFVEGYALSSGKCFTCESKTCPIIRDLKPEQYDEKSIERKLRGLGGRGRPSVSIVGLGMGLPKNLPDEIKDHIIKLLSETLPFDIDEKTIREKMESGSFSLNMGDIRNSGKSKTLADLLGSSEEDVRKWVKEQVEKKDEDTSGV